MATAVGGTHPTGMHSCIELKIHDPNEQNEQIELLSQIMLKPLSSQDHVIEIIENSVQGPLLLKLLSQYYF